VSSLPLPVDAVRIYRGDTTFMGGIEVTDPNTQLPIDFTSYVFTSQWRTNPDSGVASDLIVDVSQAVQGIVNVSMDAADAATVAGDGVWDLQSVDGDDNVETWVAGVTFFQGDVTRP
jgi:hypothetical protein